MKFKVEVECTPDEARQFFGLPDVKPMQTALMGRIETQMLDAVDRFSPDALLRSWMTFAPQSAEAMREAFERMMRLGRPS